LPPSVADALDTLERATSPAELGPPYQIVLNWRRTSGRIISWSTIRGLPLFAMLGALAWFGNTRPDLPVVSPADARGIMLVALIALALLILLRWFQDWVTPLPPPPPPTQHERVQAALDRWRHVVPAMRELPH